MLCLAEAGVFYSRYPLGGYINGLTQVGIAFPLKVQTWITTGGENPIWD